MNSKSLSIICTLIFFSTTIIAQLNTIMNNGPNSNRINVAYLGDGYQSSELGDFNSDAVNINNDLFLETPFKEYQAFFNAYAIEAASIDSGADHPGTATDVSEPAHPVSNVNTIFNTTFDYFNIHRLLVPLNSSAVYSLLNTYLPDYDVTFVLSNTPHYGGSGGALATTSLHPSASEIAIHEIGHSFGGLSDEYYAGDVYAGENENMTQETDPLLVKWADWMGINGVGIYQHCCSGNSASWYRPHQSCKMRSLGNDFCAVCTEEFIDQIYNLVSPIDNFLPSNTNTISLGIGSNIDLELDLIYPNPNTLVIEWYINGALFNIGSELINITDTDLNNGLNDIKALVRDETTLSKSFAPASGYEFEVDWIIDLDDLACPDYLAVDDDPIDDGIYHAKIELSSTGKVYNNKVVDFRSEQSIVLSPGFSVFLGGAFTAEIANCN